jgi:two-component system chemotaxis response regulator CheY
MKKLRVLVVEDSASSQTEIQDILLPYADCDGALDGISAVGKFRDALLANEPYDLICMDITMPNMDGKTALSIIREMEHQRKIKDTPVIMLTASRDALSRIETLSELKAHSYLVKPVTKETLIKELRRLKVLTEQTK